ncbi:MAG: tRNA preQ1(34) S-adenosylmethionine ribosyltransferase-isomerase QueA, partial [Sulfurospirillum sp.]|nr:tRNA preQ1(34) S-adenosylmethionine ribosyltransferase-isomerase QueA [Sulfurospirillum sp.]
MDPLLKSSYSYKLPKHLIAESPSIPRDNAKLLVFKREQGTITHTTFNKLFEFLNSNTNIILNDTKVVKARIFGHKKSGGKIELLLNSPLQNREFSVYIKGRIKINNELFFNNELTAKIISLQKDGTRIVSFYHNNQIIGSEELFNILEIIGHIPLPPYIKRKENKKDETEYQTVFSKKRGAVAAPTASLHFTDEMFQKLQMRYKTHFLTLHIGAGTFKPVEEKFIKNHIMHSEFYEIPMSTCEVISSNKPLLAVGTTVARTVECYAKSGIKIGKSDLFLHPNNKPKRVDHLLTNFHLPKSTLLMLVASFIGIEKTLEIYKIAIEKK